MRDGVALVLSCPLKYDNYQLFAKVEVNSGGHLPSRFGEVNIHRYSPTLRRIIALVYTTQLYSDSQIVALFSDRMGLASRFF